MRFKRLLFALTLALAACANPKYVSKDAPATTTTARETCQANFTTAGCIAITWERLQGKGQFGSFILKTGRANLADGTLLPEDLETLPAVTINMPSMGHETSPVTVARLDRGTYRVGKVFFTMKGEWIIHVRPDSQKSVSDEAVVPFTY